MSSSSQWAGLSKPQSGRKPSGRHRGQKLPGTPFFQVDPVVSLDRLDHPKPKVTRRRSRKASSSSAKENRSANDTGNASLSVGAEFSTSDGEKLSTDPRTELTATATFGESSVTFASEDQTTQQFLANAGLVAHDQQHADDPAIGQTITYASDEDGVVAVAADDDDFRSGLSLSYSSTLNCNKSDNNDDDNIRREVGAASSYLEYDSSLCQFRPAPSPSPFVDVPIPEKHPAAPSPVAHKDLMQPLLTAADSDRESDRTSPGPRPPSGIWSCLTCCFPHWPMSRPSRFLI